MRVLEEEHGISLVEVIASIGLITIILLSFLSIFVQSKKAHIVSESIVDTTYVAQKGIEELYGLISRESSDWLMNPKNTKVTINNVDFVYDATDTTCKNKCKKFLSVSNQEYWIQLVANNEYDSLVNVVVNVPRENGEDSVSMESIFRWGN